MEHQKDSFLTKLKSLEEKLQKQKLKTESSASTLKETISNLEFSLAPDPLSFYTSEDRASIKRLEQNISTEIHGEKQAYKTIFARLDRDVESKLSEVRTEISRERKLREDTEDGQITTFAEDISRLEDFVNSQTQEREETYDQIVKFIGQELSNFYERLAYSTRIFAEGQKSYTKMIEDLDNSIKQEIAKERRDREKADERLIKVLEDTCERVEQRSFNRFYLS